ncbi:MAG: ATP-binding protein, partial [Actinomycetota bacterium]|nr:ATP-binding protein [Actinomycetota bacterium]
GVVKVVLDVDGEHLRVLVIDHGAGVPPDREDVLFELFGRADASDSARTSGLGLGLPISDRLLARMAETSPT